MRWIINLTGTPDYVQKVNLGYYYTFTDENHATRFDTEEAAIKYLNNFEEPEKFNIQKIK